MEKSREATGGRFSIDSAHEGLDVYALSGGGTIADGHAITMDIWRDKYRWGDEKHPHESMRRVVEGVYTKDPDKDAKKDALEAMEKGLWVPAGRIQAGAGTPNVVTMLNCYMCRDIDDSMVGIMDALSDAALTQQQGGGIGMNFSTLRPNGSYLSRTGAVASGPLPFMDMWDSMCGTIMSAGARRGAMMAVMTDDHPDLPKFVVAKREAGRLTNFNMSVLVSDAFIDAIENDEDWFLGYDVPRADGKHIFVTEKEEGSEITPWYAYEHWKARDLWELIMENTYEWSEPGVIFIDRINRSNNLNYCETITGTNPCGEQPLPANGCCNLGAVNLARMVKNPFTDDAQFDFALLGQIAALGTRFLDNVIDVTLYPLESQAKEEYAKRRIGIGITGLANALAQLGIRYGSGDAVRVTDKIMNTLKQAAYNTSSLLARERGPFPLWDAERWGRDSSIVASLTPEARLSIVELGMRNGVLLTIAPTGTTSLYVGNVSSGLEPVFAHKAQRNVRQADGEFEPYTVYDYGYLLYMHVKGYKSDGAHGLPDYMVTADALDVREHIDMQGVCQAHVDASVSKTINCPQDITFEDFKGLYEYAYESGCKGCTTYRYSEVRGSVLSVAGAPGQVPAVATSVVEAPVLVRPEVLTGRTYKIKWPNADENYYITVNDVGGKAFEVFIHSTSSKYSDWMTALGLMISAIMRKGGDISFIPTELGKVKSADDSGFVGDKFYGSLVALIGDTIGRHLFDGDTQRIDRVPPEISKNPHAAVMAIKASTSTSDLPASPREICPECYHRTLTWSEGCEQCLSCTYSKCS